MTDDNKISAGKKDPISINRPGILTWEATKFIRDNLNKNLFDLYYHHGEASAFRGQIVSSIEEEYKRGDRLAQLDIAIVKKDTDDAVVLIEIEDTTDKPKTLISDLFGTLMGNFISLRGNRKLRVGNHTTLIILAKGKNHEDRIIHIREKAVLAKPHMGTKNSVIGNIVIEPFADGKELNTMVMKKINEAIRWNA